MTKREAAIIMAYTDTCMLAGDDLKYFYKYISEILGYEVQTLDLAKTDLIKEKSKGDFMRLCEGFQNELAMNIGNNKHIEIKQMKIVKSDDK